MFSIVYNCRQGGSHITIRSHAISARVSGDLKNYLDTLVERGMAINTSEAVKICIRYAKQKKMEEEL